MDIAGKKLFLYFLLLLGFCNLLLFSFPKEIFAAAACIQAGYTCIPNGDECIDYNKCDSSFSCGSTLAKCCMPCPTNTPKPPTPTPNPTKPPSPCVNAGYSCYINESTCGDYGRCPSTYSCNADTLMCCRPCPTPTPTPTITPAPCGQLNKPCCSTNPICTQGTCTNGTCKAQCNTAPRTTYCDEAYSPDRLITCQDYKIITSSECGLGCNATNTGCNEESYCENWCDTTACSVPKMRIYCWYARDQKDKILSYWDTPVCCNNSPYCDGSGCTAYPPPTPFCHPVTNVCHADTLVPPCKDQYPSAPYEWIDNCGGISCLADPCTAPTTAPGDPICVPDCSCAANTCIGQTCTDPRCGGICNGSRDCSVTLTATAKYFASVPANCSDITNPAQGSYLYPVTFTMSGSPSTLTSKQLVSPNPNVSWTNVQVGTYSIVSAPPPSPEYQYVTTCWTKSDGDSGQASSITFSPTEIGVTGNFFVAFGPPGPWHQTQEGDVYSGGTLQTFVPSTAANRYYTLAGAGGTRGVITANTLSVLPTPDWRISGHSNPTQNYYASYLRKAATTTKTPLNPGTVSSFPASSTVYTTTGDLTFGNGSTLTVPDGVSVVYLVDGNVTITQPLTLANPNTSFLAIIARGTLLTA